MKTITFTLAGRLQKSKKAISGFIVATMLLFGLGMTERVQAQAGGEEAVVVPSWAPAYDHVDQVRYYYLPDLCIFYDVYSSQFIYRNGSYWVGSYTLPRQYQGYDLNTAYVVLLSKHAKNPWKYYQEYNAYYPCHYYYRLNDQSASGYNENSKALVYKTDYINGTQTRQEALERANRDQHSAYNNAPEPERNTLRLLDDKKDSRSNSSDLKYMR